MATVWSDPAGFTVDWDWQRGLTVWALAGRRVESRFDHKVLEHELPFRPSGERQARVAARRWWRARGRAQVFGAVRDDSEQAGP